MEKLPYKSWLVSLHSIASSSGIPPSRHHVLFALTHQRCWFLVSQNERGLLGHCCNGCWCVGFCWSTTVCNLERILPSPCGRRWPLGRMRGFWFGLVFLSSGWFVWCPSPTTNVVPPLPKNGRGFSEKSAKFFIFSVGSRWPIGPDERMVGIC